MFDVEQITYLPECIVFRRMRMLRRYLRTYHRYLMLMSFAISLQAGSQPAIEIPGASRSPVLAEPVPFPVSNTPGSLHRRKADGQQYLLDVGGDTAIFTPHRSASDMLGRERVRGAYSRPALYRTVLVVDIARG